jgi:tetratricopeptide (TPR) repeat protein
VNRLHGAAQALQAGLLAAFMTAAFMTAASNAVAASAEVSSPKQPSPSPNSKDPILQANAALQAGEADKALTLLQSLPQPVPAQAHNLACRVRFTLEQWDAAIKECEQAVRMDKNNSLYHLWLGRALGEKASRASFFSAFSTAKRVRAEFEEAVRLDPRNAEALSDLGEFYYDAPGVVGGGIDKAGSVASQLDKVEPARAHDLRGRIAAAQKDFGTAEREFKLALAADAHPAFQWVTLASFYRQRQRWNEMESAIHNIIDFAQHDKHAAVTLYDGASVLTKANRDPQLAAKMLNDYLASPAKSEEAPAFVAYTRLARLDAQLGDTAGAQRQREAAIALAHDYKPALDPASQETKH